MFLLQLWKLKKTILINFFSIICTRKCVKNNVIKLSTTSYVISKWRQNVIKMASKELPSISLKLREKCPNTELFLVRIFLHSDWIRRDTPYFPTFGLNTERYSYLSVFSPNAGKYRLEIIPYLDTFHGVWVVHNYGWSEEQYVKLSDLFPPYLWNCR